MQLCARPPTHTLCKASQQCVLQTDDAFGIVVVAAASIIIIIIDEPNWSEREPHASHCANWSQLALANWSAFARTNAFKG